MSSNLPHFARKTNPVGRCRNSASVRCLIQQVTRPVASVGFILVLFSAAPPVFNGIWVNGNPASAIAEDSYLPAGNLTHIWPPNILAVDEVYPLRMKQLSVRVYRILAFNVGGAYSGYCRTGVWWLS